MKSFSAFLSFILLALVVFELMPSLETAISIKTGALDYSLTILTFLGSVIFAGLIVLTLFVMHLIYTALDKLSTKLFTGKEKENDGE